MNLMVSARCGYNFEGVVYRHISGINIENILDEIAP